MSSASSDASDRFAGHEWTKKSLEQKDILWVVLEDGSRVLGLRCRGKEKLQPWRMAKQTFLSLLGQNAMDEVETDKALKKQLQAVRESFGSGCLNSVRVRGLQAFGISEQQVGLRKGGVLGSGRDGHARWLAGQGKRVAQTEVIEPIDSSEDESGGEDQQLEATGPAPRWPEMLRLAQQNRDWDPASPKFDESTWGGYIQKIDCEQLRWTHATISNTFRRKAQRTASGDFDEPAAERRECCGGPASSCGCAGSAGTGVGREWESSIVCIASFCRPTSAGAKELRCGGQGCAGEPC
ncbi:unnamed protein product [Effrenium voratum]|nr:unnamed protein product [Effrenium voratum]